MTNLKCVYHGLAARNAPSLKTSVAYRSAIFAAMTASLGVATDVAAQEIAAEQYVGGKARVNQAAKLRTYSEEIAASSCRLSAGIDQDAAAHDLARARSDVSTILAGLRDGNPALGIPTAEAYSTNISSIENVTQVWAGVDKATAAILANPSDQPSLEAVGASYNAMFDSTVILESDISGKYSDPLELLQADAITLNFASRQTTLLMRMERITCGMVTGNAAFGTTDDLADTVNLFERSLIALRDGYPDAGIPAPPNEAVAGSLASIYDHWIAEKAVLEGIITNGGDGASAAQVAEMTQALIKEVNNTITLYLIATPGQEGVYRLPVQAYAEAELANWLSNDDMIATILSQNANHATLSEADIIAQDQDWRAQAKGGGGDLIDQLLTHDVSAWLRDQQSGTAGLVTEVFIMDNRGLNVAQSVKTSDYWQGDEAKWQETYGVEGDVIHIAEIEFDDSTGFYQTQASMPIFDKATNEKIGAITFGINVQSLM